MKPFRKEKGTKSCALWNTSVYVPCGILSRWIFLTNRSLVLECLWLKMPLESYHGNTCLQNGGKESLKEIPNCCGHFQPQTRTGFCSGGIYLMTLDWG